MSILAKLKIIRTIAKEGTTSELVTRITERIYSTEESYVLRRDLTVPLVRRPEAKLPISVRPLEPRDVPQIFAERPSGLHLGILHAGLPQCYAALTNDDEVCYIQWLVSPEHREQLRSVRFRDTYAFDDESVVLEFAYTFKRFRGLGIMAPAMAYIAEQNKRAHWAVTYVSRSNIPSLRGCRSAGFSPYRLRLDKWRFFRLIQSIDNPKSLEPFWNEAGTRNRSEAS